MMKCWFSPGQSDRMQETRWSAAVRPIPGLTLVLNKARQQLHKEPRLTFQATEERPVNW